MSNVKIHTVTSDQLSPPVAGEAFCTDMVRYEDYAKLEAQVKQLAAENAARRDAIERIATAYTAGDPAGFEIERARAIVNVGGDAFLSRLRNEARAEGARLLREAFRKHCGVMSAREIDIFIHLLREGKAGEVSA